LQETNPDVTLVATTKGDGSEAGAGSSWAISLADSTANGALQHDVHQQGNSQNKREIMKPTLVPWSSSRVVPYKSSFVEDCHLQQA
jgi:hypothetical protein